MNSGLCNIVLALSKNPKFTALLDIISCKCHLYDAESECFLRHNSMSINTERKK